MESEKQAKIIKFADIKDKVLNALNQKINQGTLRFAEKIEIVDGFVNQPLTMEMSNSFVLGGPSIPMILLVGNSGQLYFFALKALLPNFDK